MGSGTAGSRFEKPVYIHILLVKRICYNGDLTIYSGNPNMVMALAGNKADLLDARKVSPEV